MKKFLVLVSALLVILTPAQAFAGTVTEKAPIFWYGRQGDFQKQFAGSMYFNGGNGNSIQTVTFDNINFDGNTYVTVYFWETGTYTPTDQNGKPLSTGPVPYEYTLGSTDVYGNGLQTISVPTGTNVLDFYGSAGAQVAPEPMPWSYVTQETDTNGNTYNLPAPPGP
ncbi:MAG: hypothetical protein QW100_02195 [Thermoplasmatales archaeon]